jgi:peptide/nickel transport system permease protein
VARYVLGRVLQALVVLWAAFTVTFAILYLLPSDPVKLQLGAAGMDDTKLTPQQLHDFEARYGLDQPMWRQYVDHLLGALHGDFGHSIAQQGAPVTQLLGERIGNTLQLSVAAALMTVVLGGTLAFVATYVEWRPLRVLLTRLPALGASFPLFFVALVLIQVFAFQLGWFPATGSQGIGSLVMPALTISVLTSSVLAQVLIKSFDETLQQAYVTTARAKGVSRIGVHLKHCLRNAVLPAMTILGIIVGLTVTSSIVVETIFTRQGIGQLAQQSVLSQDVPVVLAIVTLAAAVFVTVNLVVDLLYPLLDPRITHVRAVRRAPARKVVPA